MRAVPPTRIVVGSTLQAKLASSKHLTQVHLKMSSRTLENLASYLMTKYILEAQTVSHLSLSNQSLKSQIRLLVGKIMKPLQQKNVRRCSRILGNSATKEAKLSSAFVENGSATWFSAKKSPQGF